MENTEEIAAIVLNWNSYTDTKTCLDSLLSQNHPNLSIYIVDNGSTDGSGDKIAKEYGEKANIIKLKSNRGFSGGVNRGLQELNIESHDYILLINNDVIIDGEHVLSDMANKLRMSDSVGAVSPIVKYNNSNKIWFKKGNINKNIMESYHDSYYNPILHGTRKKTRCISPNLISNDYIPFCCVLIKTEVIEACGRLDENFFLYYEDTEYCLRILNYGYQLATLTTITVSHKVQASSETVRTPISEYYGIRNRIYLYKKQKGRIGFWLLISIAMKLFAIIVRSVRHKTLVNFFGALIGLKDGVVNNMGKGPYP